MVHSCSVANVLHSAIYSQSSVLAGWDEPMLVSSTKSDSDSPKKNAPPGQGRGVIGTTCIKPTKVSHRSGTTLVQSLSRRLLGAINFESFTDL
jgi:hypothetical protein